MAIRIEQPGATEAAARTGSILGKAQRAKEERARAEREQARADAAAMQRQARQDEIKFALQKRQIDWQRALVKEQRSEDYRLMAEDRAAERAIERIELSKDLDHQYKEQERQRQRQEINNKRTEIQKDIDAGHSKEKDHAITLFNLDQAELAIDLGARPSLVSKIPLDTDAAEQRAAGRYTMTQEAHKAKMAMGAKRTDIDAAIKFLQEYEEKKTKAEKWRHPFASEPTKEENIAAQYYRDILGQVSPPDTGANIPGGIISSGLPTPKTEQEYAAIPIGSRYVSSTGDIRTKR
jgi:hypothetical protein